MVDLEEFVIDAMQLFGGGSGLSPKKCPYSVQQSLSYEGKSAHSNLLPGDGRKIQVGPKPKTGNIRTHVPIYPRI